jgi:hypothetical protein
MACDTQFDRAAGRDVRTAVRPGGNKAPIFFTGENRDTLLNLVHSDFGPVQVIFVGCLSHAFMCNTWTGRPFMFVEAKPDRETDAQRVVDKLIHTECFMMDGCRAVFVNDIVWLINICPSPA